jgi:hypothetical protein
MKMSGAGAVKAMQEHMKRYRLYQQKVREYERLQKQIEEETAKSWREIGGLTDLEEVYGPIVAMRKEFFTAMAELSGMRKRQPFFVGEPLFLLTMIFLS